VFAIAAIMPHAQQRSKREGVAIAELPRMISAKRNGESAAKVSTRHCERSEAIQDLTME